MSRTRAVYVGSDGNYYGEADIWERFETGCWAPFAWDSESGEEWVETDEQQLLVLTPTSPEELPQRVDIERTEAGLSIDSAV
ncbi:hypothetical protein [Halapricum hydrolyticum]|uniref:Trimethylamine methyltransferase family protein n=1 Tax=Halapricum hydrolyticum TaxID=2979991 RepID=A0AAE3IF33_9EURY|nr:hypothetical protein [Halapricum hydrolyticum]MCU4719089.1 trimethylamine methyltransferase family protein [Halapricum hydrolyticum]MCU4728138.1 trimethylamine methyltransferase family protein [Halapricum hydrolyticum]